MLDTEVIRIPLTRGLFATVDARDFALVSKYAWHANTITGGRVYAKTSLPGGSKRNQKRVSMHQLIMGCPGGHIDHVSGDALDNRRANLRIATNSQNQQNKRKSSAAKHSIYKGVSYHKRARKWQAEITLDNKKRYIGTYPTEALAALAYDDAARDLHGEFARLNFPQPNERSALV